MAMTLPLSPASDASPVSPGAANLNATANTNTNSNAASPTSPTAPTDAAPTGTGEADSSSTNSSTNNSTAAGAASASGSASNNSNNNSNGNNSNNNGSMKRKPSRRANTAERRATHNAVERQRRETLNGRFLDLAALLPNLSQIRRPSKSSIVNSSIAHIHASRRHRLLASRELRLLKAEADALRRENNEWRDRAGLPRVEEPVRGEGFSSVVSGELEVVVVPGVEEGEEGMEGVEGDEGANGGEGEFDAEDNNATGGGNEAVQAYGGNAGYDMQEVEEEFVAAHAHAQMAAAGGYPSSVAAALAHNGHAASYNHGHGHGSMHNNHNHNHPHAHSHAMQHQGHGQQQQHHHTSSYSHNHGHPASYGSHGPYDGDMPEDPRLAAMMRNGGSNANGPFAHGPGNGSASRPGTGNGSYGHGGHEAGFGYNADKYHPNHGPGGHLFTPPASAHGLPGSLTSNGSNNSRMRGHHGHGSVSPDGSPNPGAYNTNNNGHGAHGPHHGHNGHNGPHHGGHGMPGGLSLNTSLHSPGMNGGLGSPASSLHSRGSPSVPPNTAVSPGGSSGVGVGVFDAPTFFGGAGALGRKNGGSGGGRGRSASSANQPQSPAYELGPGAADYPTSGGVPRYMGGMMGMGMGVNVNGMNGMNGMGMMNGVGVGVVSGGGNGAGNAMMMMM